LGYARSYPPRRQKRSVTLTLVVGQPGARGKAHNLPEKWAFVLLQGCTLRLRRPTAEQAGLRRISLARRQFRKAARAMNRISGSLAVLAGFFLLLPGVFAMFHTAASTAPMPIWLIRDLAVASFSGAVLLYWGASAIRHREMELNDLQPVRGRR
jgi:hypothetical protein